MWVTVLEAVGAKGKEKQIIENVFMKDGNVTVNSKQQYVPKYKSEIEDVLWASKGLVVMVLNGEAIPVVQRRIFDAGFDSLDLIPMGADKVLVRSSDNREVSSILSEASEFFLYVCKVEQRSIDSRKRSVGTNLWCATSRMEL